METPVTLPMLAEILRTNNEQLLSVITAAQIESDNRMDTEFAAITERFNKVEKLLQQLVDRG